MKPSSSANAHKWRIFAVFVLLVTTILVGFSSTSLMSETHGGLSGMSAGTGSDARIQAFRTESGIHVHYSVTSVTSQPLDVYLVTYDEFQNYRLAEAFSYLPQGSARNVTEFDATVVLDDNTEIYDLIVASNVSGAIVPFTLTYEQAPFPLVLSWLPEVLYLVCWIGAMALMFLLVAMISKRKSGDGSSR